MKKLLASTALALGLMFGAAQQVAPAKNASPPPAPKSLKLAKDAKTEVAKAKAKTEVAKVEVKGAKTEIVKAKTEVAKAKVEVKDAKATANNAGIKLKKDGTPDKRFKNAPSTGVHLKKDGTPDKRFKENK